MSENDWSGSGRLAMKGGCARPASAVAQRRLATSFANTFTPGANYDGLGAGREAAGVEIGKDWVFFSICAGGNRD